MNRLYKVLFGIFIGILAIYLYPSHWIDIVLAVIAAIWLEFTFGDLITYASLKKLQLIKKEFRERWMKIGLYICIKRNKYTGVQKHLIKNALEKIQSSDENVRKMGFEELSQFKGGDSYKKLLNILKTGGEVYMEVKRILWIDYDANILMELARPLEKDGYKVIVAKDEKEALELIEKSKFDLILSDIIIPTGIKGDEENIPFVGMRLLKILLIAREIKTPIVVLSVVRDPEMINEMYEMGVKRVLQKGECLSSELKKEVYKVLEVQE